MSCTLIILKYSLTSKNIACTSPSQDQFYYDDVDSSSNLSLGDVIYTDSNCTLPAPDGWYIDFNTNPNTVFRVSGGNGIVTSIEYCTEPSPSPTPTLTLSTTPTPTPTPTPCPNNCVQYSASTISGCDLSYTNCEGDGVFTVVSAPGLLFCANSTYPITTDCALVTIGCCPIPSVTPTPSETPSVTPSVTPSLTPSVTPSLTPSVTPSLTPSNTPSLTPSVTPSETPSVTPSVTPSLTPSETPSVTPSVTPTSNTTPSVTPSLTPSVTPSETPSVTPSVTPTSNTTPSVTPSLTPSVTPTSNTTPSVTPSLTPSVTPSITPTSNTTPSVTPSLTPSITPSLTPSTTSGGPCVNDTVTPKGVKISFNSGSNYTNCDVYTGLTSTNITGVTSCTGMTTGNFCQITGITATLMEMYVRIVCEGCCEQVFRINLDECCDYTPSSPTPTPSITLSVTPSVTSSVTPSPTSNTTPSVTPSTTPSTTPSVTTSTTPSITPTITPTNTPSTSVTPTITITPTPSTTPGPSILLGRTIPDAGDSSTACSTYLSSRSYFIAPGKTLSTLVNGDIIYDSYPGTPTNGGNNWVALTVGGVGLKRAFQIDSNGVILDTFNCP